MDSTASLLLDWYDREGRCLPWRARPGDSVDPYRVWLSEIMLQQTTVQTVIPYYNAFLERWPTVADLATAELEAVLHAWQGLGYYARARHLKACADAVMARHGGRFPETEAALRTLPGVGPYTAAAVAAIAFGRRAVVVDGNVERVMARVFNVETPLPDSRPALTAHADHLTPTDRPGDYAQAVMDLGALICTPRNPACALCPWRDGCAGRRAGDPARLPAKRPKPPRPTRHGGVFWTQRGDGRVLVRQRPTKGLLGGMMEFPNTGWESATPWADADLLAAVPAAGRWQVLGGGVKHTFTHFHLELRVLTGVLHGKGATLTGTWVAPEALDTQAMPTLMRKVAKHVLRHGYRREETE